MIMNVTTSLAQYTPIRLTADSSHLSANTRQILRLLIEAAEAMDEPFWIQNYGDREALLSMTADPDLQRLILFNYGPWDHFQKHKPFIDDVGQKPVGANFYPPDMTTGEFEAAAITESRLKSPYTIVRWDSQKNLVPIPYHNYFQNHVRPAAEKLRQAAEIAQEPGLKTYLSLRAAALLTDDYQASDYAWVDMKDNSIDILIGPMEIEDRLLGIKTAYAASVFIKDWKWAEQLNQYIKLLPRFQQSLPIPDTYKQERPELESELCVYDLIYTAGNDKSSIPSGIAWPNDEEVQLEKGTRSILVRNVMMTRFEKMYLPLADMFIDPRHRPNVTFEGHFNYVMLHELAHGIGIKHTIHDKRLVKEALKDLNHLIEEGKAEILAQLMMNQLHQWGLVSEADLHNMYITTLVKLLYNGESRQSAICLKWFKELGAYTRDSQTGTYTVNMEKIETAVHTLAERFLRLLSQGDYEEAKAFVERYGRPDEDLEHDNNRINAANIPFGLAIEQGLEFI
jgi:hypothetical protein